VHVHVPESGDEPLAAAVDDVSADWDFCRYGRADSDDARAVYDDGEIRARRRSLDVHHRHMGDGNDLHGDRER
jgi:hypothetical protein